MSRSVEDIMRERGVGKRYAYTLLRRERSAAAGEAPQSQSTRVLVAIYQHTGRYRRAGNIEADLKAAGYGIDAHDTAKALWSLQKAGYVRFRESSKYGLNGIVLTEAGMAAGARAQWTFDLDVDLAKQPLPDFEQPQPSREQILEAEASSGWSPTDLDALHPHRDEMEAVVVERLESCRLNLSDYPLLVEVMERASRVRRVTAAIQILEEVGEDGIALDLMERFKSSPLEDEIVRFLGEIGASGG